MAPMDAPFVRIRCGAMTHPFEILAQPIRRRIIEVLAVGDHTAGELCDVVTVENRVSRTAVSHHLATLLWDHRYGPAQRRAPIVDPPRTRARVHRAGDAARRRRERSAREWNGEDAPEHAS
jgi:DNA-binding transcriptional ArsR family regulator